MKREKNGVRSAFRLLLPTHTLQLKIVHLNRDRPKATEFAPATGAGTGILRGQEVWAKPPTRLARQKPPTSLARQEDRSGG
jgi:hypothetical protein